MTRGDQAIYRAGGGRGKSMALGMRGSQEIRFTSGHPHSLAVCVPVGGSETVGTQLSHLYTGAEEGALAGLCEDPVRLGVMPCRGTKSTQEKTPV